MRSNYIPTEEQLEHSSLAAGWVISPNQLQRRCMCSNCFLRGKLLLCMFWHPPPVGPMVCTVIFYAWGAVCPCYTPDTWKVLDTYFDLCHFPWGVPWISSDISQVGHWLRGNALLKTLTATLRVPSGKVMRSVDNVTQLLMKVVSVVEVRKICVNLLVFLLFPQTIESSIFDPLSAHLLTWLS